MRVHTRCCMRVSLLLLLQKLWFSCMAGELAQPNTIIIVLRFATRTRAYMRIDITIRARTRMEHRADASCLSLRTHFRIRNPL